MEQQQQQRPVIWWERFLPRRSLRVLLVESDDSTRHIVSALLRKCSYNVSTVADGMKAWDVLEEKEYRFDLVLSEVEMPSLSCMGLLCKIMGCELSRNIPVVMMSSQDSVMVVFNCMRKGAVDFLVKPLRKNELKNLWQHVWRKNCSISHSNALESTYDNQMKSEHVSGTNTVANNVFLHVDSDLRIEENHNEENDGQSSSSKPETKSQSVQRYQDSSMFEVRNSDLLSTKNLEKPFHDDMLMGPARKKHFVPNGGSNSSRNRGEASNLLEKTVVDDINRGDDGICIRSAPERECKSGTDTVGDSESHSSFPKSSSQNNITDFIGPVANRVCCYAASEKDSNREKFQCVATDSSFGSNATNSGAHPLWELSLRGPSLNSSGKQGLQESHVLMQSSGSAFSKYGGSDSRNSFQKSKCSPSSLLAANNEGKNQSTSSNGPGMEDASSCRPWMLKSCHAKKAQVIRCHQVSSGSNEDSQHFGACLSKETGNVGLSNSDHDNQSKVFHTTQLRHEVPFFPVEGMSLQGMQAGYGAMIQPLFYSNLPPHCVIASETTNDFLSSAPFGQNCNNLEYDDSSKQNCCHYNHERLIADVTVDMGDGNPQTLISTDIEQTNQRGSFQQTVVNGGGSSRNEEMMEAGLTVVGTERETEYDFQSCNIKVLDCKQSQREAALIKFRMKMKERCFEKKVRYQSRKKLAERRPRVKGQFVRQSAIMSPVVTLEEDH